MKTKVSFGIGLIAGAALIGWAGSTYWANQVTAKVKAQQALWDKERAQLEAALQAARSRPAEKLTVTNVETVMTNAPSATPQEILQELIALRIGNGPEATLKTRRLIVLFDELIAAGEPALPLIREFLERYEDVDYETAINDLRRGWRGGRLNTDFVLAPSLRLGLFDAVRRIGGSEAETILVEMLSGTGRGVEVAYLTSVLESISPGKYRHLALQAAHELLTNPPAYDQPNRLERNDDDFLYGVMAFYKDTSFAVAAQMRLVGADGRIDESTLRYLQETLGEQSLSMVHQALNDPRITDQNRKEPLVEAVLSYVGSNAQADQIFSSLVTNPNLPARLREEALSELDDEGINDDNPSARDLDIIRQRLATLNQMRESMTERNLVNRANRVQQSLQRMLDRAAQSQTVVQ